MNTDDPLTQLRKTVAAWARNRELYPGWLIAPSEARGAIWFHTVNWIGLMVARLNEVDYQERLVWCHELNWRFEVALVPLLPPVSDAVIELIKSRNPFTDGGLSPDDGSADQLAVIRTQWLDLALAILRFYREGGLTQEFHELVASLEPIVKVEPDRVLRVAYERCLLALGRLNYQEARSLAESAQLGMADPFWLVRFAAVLCELDEPAGAEEKADEALRLIRSRIDPLGRDLTMPSREGWAMLLARGLKWAKPASWHQAGGSNELQMFEGRWNQLELLKCNPGPQLEDLRLRLEHPPIPRPQEEISVGFDHLERRLTYHHGSGLPDYILTALQASRLIEEVGYPPRCGMWTMSADILRTVIRSMGGYSPSVVLPLMLRADIAKESDRFSRHEVAALSEEESQRLFDLLYAAVSNLLPDIASERGGPNIRRGFGNRHLATAVELLSRLTVRAGPDDVNRSLLLSLQMINSTPLRHDISLESAAWQLLARTLESAPADLISRQFLALLQLPLWPAPDARPNYSNAPSLAQLVGPRRFSLEQWQSSEDWRFTIANLLRVAEQGRGLERSDALLRLLTANTKGGLSADQQQGLARAYWRGSDESQWVLAPYLASTSMLTVPDTGTGLGARMFKQWCTQQALPRFREPAPAGQPGSRPPIVVNTERDNLLYSLVAVSRDPEPTERQFEALQWSDSEAKAIFSNIWTWWEAEKADAAELLGSSHIKDQAYRRFYDILRVIAFLVLPHAQAIPDFSERLKELVEALDQLRFPTVCVVPLLASALGLSWEEVEMRLRRDLVSMEENFVDAALEGLCEWITWEKVRGLPPVPVDLLTEMAGIVAGRRRPGLLFALHGIAFVARRRPDLLIGRVLDSIRIGLNYLFTETEYEPHPDVPQRRPIEYAELPRFRQAAAAVAAAVEDLPGLRNDSIIVRWLERAKNDPLPEIRQVLEAD